MPHGQKGIRALGLLFVSLGPLLVSAGAALLLFELAYRLQVPDFYAPELAAYNRPADLVARPGGSRTCLVIGDSFGAGLAGSFPAGLRDALPGLRVINSSVSGIGIIEARLIAPGRFARFDPELFVYQIYIGNDLFDIRYPSDLRASGPVRWAYWNVANHLRSVEFLNYRLGQSAALQDTIDWLRGEVETSAVSREELSDHRERMIYAADPGLLEETVLLQGRRREDFLRLVEDVRAILGPCVSGRCRAFVLVVPHKVQVTPEYLRQYESLGATFADPDAIRGRDSPFVRALAQSLADADHVSVIDPLLAIQEAEAAGRRLFLADDEHLNEDGQALLARRVADAISSGGASSPTEDPDRAAGPAP